MEKIDVVLKRTLVIAIASCLVIGGVVWYLQLKAQQRQTRRMVIYLQARRLAAQEQQQRLADYQKRLEQQRRTREYERTGSY